MFATEFTIARTCGTQHRVSEVEPEPRQRLLDEYNPSRIVAAVIAPSPLAGEGSRSGSTTQNG